ncbi:MAG: hypothetical protein JNL36_07815 [Candidatus Kapabacteria bacterium]|nr:hypothetical protein [Candidatus Kapabacteria bacterium]
MEKQEFIIHIIGRKGNETLSLDNFTIKEQVKILQIAQKICSVEGSNANELVPKFEEGSWILKITGLLVAINSITLTIEEAFKNNDISMISAKSRQGLIELKNFCQSNNLSTEFKFKNKVIGKVDPTTEFNKSKNYTIQDATILIGVLDVIGFQKEPKIILKDEEENKSYTIHTTNEVIESIHQHLYKEVAVEVSYKRFFETNEVLTDSYKLVDLKPYSLEKSYAEIRELQKHFDFSFLGDRDSVDYVRELRGKDE